jgi:EmrB/QacA subfamily drug resistance transporter
MADFNKSQINALIVILATYLLILLDTSVVITGLPQIQESLGFSQVGLSWVQNAYTLSFGSLLMLGARAGDIVGRKRIFRLGILIFTLSSLVIGLAPSATVMIVARVIQGASAAILAPTTLALLSTYFKEGPERVKALSFYAATAGIGATAGLVLGGLFAGLLSWRVGFLVNVPIGIVLFLVTNKLLAETEQHSGKLDIQGAITSTLGMSAIIFGIISSSSLGWIHWVTISMISGGLVLIIVFLLVEAKNAHPLLPLHLFKSRERSAAYISRFLFLGAMVSFFFFSTQFMQRVLLMTPAEAGLGFVPMTGFTFLASQCVPRLTKRLGGHGVTLLALGFCAVGFGILANMTPGSSYWQQMLLPMIIVGFGNGAVLGPLTVSGVAGVEAKDTGAASGLVNVAHQIGGTFGLSMLAVLYASSGKEGLDALHQLSYQINIGFYGCMTLITLAIVATAYVSVNLKPSAQPQNQKA